MKIIKRIIIYTLLLLLYTACGGGVDTPDGGGDTTPPTATGSIPTPNSTVSAPSSITVSFNEPIDPATVTPTSFVIVDSASKTMAAPNDGSWGIHPFGDTVIEFIPNTTLPDGPTTITVTTALTDSAGNNFAADQSWTFTIASGDAIAPLFLSGDPNGAVFSACSVTATFDEPIDVTTVTPTSFEITDSSSYTMIATDGTWALDPSSPAQIKFVPNVPLPIGTTNVILTTAITDDAGNPLAAGEAWSFTTTLPCAP